jgi:pilus assembly protein CpaB
MKRRLISVILFAVLAALVSSTLIYKMISGSSTQVAIAKTAPVLVAVRDLDPGAVVIDGDVTSVEWPAADGAPWIAQKTNVVGRALLTSVAKGEPFSESRLAAKGSGGGLASRIPPGMRVVAVHVDELTGLSRFIFPGMHVDVISTGAASGQNAQAVVTRTILQNIEVLSSGDPVARDAKDKAAAVPVFNLIVTPKQAEILSQAVAQTRIQLVLRNPLDKSSVVAELASPEPVAPVVRRPQMRVPAPVAKPIEEKKVTAEAPPAPPPMPTVEVIHGDKRAISTVSPVTGSETHK